MLFCEEIFFSLNEIYFKQFFSDLLFIQLCEAQESYLIAQHNIQQRLSFNMNK